jgi:hypothetical protein
LLQDFCIFLLNIHITCALEDGFDLQS